MDRCQRYFSRRAVLGENTAPPGRVRHGTKVQFSGASAEGSVADGRVAGGADKGLPGKKVARYLQIESKVRALIRYELAAGIPLIP